MDETTDIGCKKQAAMLAKYVDDDGSVQTRFYDMKACLALIYVAMSCKADPFHHLLYVLRIAIGFD